MLSKREQILLFPSSRVFPSDFFLSFNCRFLLNWFVRSFMRQGLCSVATRWQWKATQKAQAGLSLDVTLPLLKRSTFAPDLTSFVEDYHCVG